MLDIKDFVRTGVFRLPRKGEHFYHTPTQDVWIAREDFCSNQWEIVLPKAAAANRPDAPSVEREERDGTSHAPGSESGPILKSQAPCDSPNSGGGNNLLRGGQGRDSTDIENNPVVGVARHVDFLIGLAMGAVLMIGILALVGFILEKHWNIK